MSPSSEPNLVCSGGNRLFVACDNYLIEEFDMMTSDCHKVRQFYAVGRVLQMVYSHSGEFLATIEKDTFRNSSPESSSNFLFRVYSNLDAISRGNPMKVRISGQVTRARARKRTADVIETDQLIVIETPLKRAPYCIAAYAQNIAIAIKRTVLVYACEKNADETRDIRCVLELEFVFTVRRLELCEEFVMCSAGFECQIVQLNLDNSLKTLIDAAENVPSHLSVQSFFAHKVLLACLPSDGHNSVLDKCRGCGENGCTHLAGRDSASDKTTHSCESGSTAVGSQHATVHGNHEAQEDTGKTDPNCSMKRHLVRQDPVSDCLSNPPSPPQPRRAANKVKETLGGGLELLGPVPGEFHMCLVSVEFEGLERHGRGRSGVLENGITTLLYKKLEPHSNPIHSIQLLPVFVDEETSISQEADSSCLFLSPKRKRLVGMFGIASTATYAYVYSLLSDCRLISSFPFALETQQVKLTESHIYAMTETRLDVYTARCLSSIIFDAEESGRKMQQTMPFVQEEPCLLGYHTFFDLTAMCHTGDYLTLLSKSNSASGSTNSNWSIYVLKRPEVSSLYNDMVDQAYEWERILAPDSVRDRFLSEPLCLMQEAYMFLRSHLYLQRSSDKKKELTLLFRKSCLYLAQFYQRLEGKEHLAVPYYLMAEFSLMDIVQNVLNSKVKVSSRFKEALMWFGRKLTDTHFTNDLVSELEKAGIVNGCLKKLHAIAGSNDDGPSNNEVMSTST